MKVLITLASFILLFSCSPSHVSTNEKLAGNYFPNANWLVHSPQKEGMDSALLQQAVDFAKTQETTQMKPDFSTQEEIFGKVLGPMPSSRAATNGIILRHGYIVAEWGDTHHPDPTYSIAKSFLSIIMGITLDRGIVKSEKDLVSEYKIGRASCRERV